MRARLRLDELQGGTDGVSRGIGRAAQQSVRIAHLHEHRAEIVALGQRLAALLCSHLALAQGDHLLDHLVHAGIGRGVDDLQALDVEAALDSCCFDLFGRADEDRGKEAALLQAVGSLEDTGIRPFGKDNLARICLENFNQTVKHESFLQYDRASARFSACRKNPLGFPAKLISKLQNYYLYFYFAILPLRRVIECERTP